MLPQNLLPETLQFITQLRTELERQNVTQEFDEALFEFTAMNYHAYRAYFPIEESEILFFILKQFVRKKY